MRTFPRLKSLLPVFVLFGFFTLVGTAATYGQCTSPDAKIITDISDRVAKDGNLSPQSGHFNVMSTNGAVAFYGWVDSAKDADRLQNIALTTACVRLVNMSGLLDAPPPPNSPMRPSPTTGCATGTKPCGDICIPEADSCNIKGAAAKAN